MQGKKVEFFFLSNCEISVEKKNGKLQGIYAVISVNDSTCVTYKLDSAVIIFLLNSLIFITATGPRLFRFPAAFKALSSSDLCIASRW